MPSDKEVVDFIQELFKDKRRWTKRSLARRADGVACTPAAPDSASFCLSGACLMYSSDTKQELRLRQLIEKYLPNTYQGIVSFNDHPRTTIEDVRHVLRSVQLHFKHSH